MAAVVVVFAAVVVGVDVVVVVVIVVIVGGFADMFQDLPLQAFSPLNSRISNKKAIVFHKAITVTFFLCKVLLQLGDDVIRISSIEHARNHA